MPHTSRKRKQTRPKRLEVMDENGWTRITSSTARISERHKLSTNLCVGPNAGIPIDEHISTVPDDMTVEKAKAHFAKIEARWLKSSAWDALRALLERIITKDTRVDCAVVFGTGSFTGFRDGWIERHDVALYQLSVLKNMVRVIEGITDQKIPMYAQEPTYNSIDTELLSSLNITKVDNPRGFELMTKDSLAYSPGAELAVQMTILSVNPALHLTHKLDIFWRNEKGQVCTNTIAVEHQGTFVDAAPFVYSSDPEKRELTSMTPESLEADMSIYEGFLEDKASSQLPELDDVQDYPFHEQCLYWRKGNEKVKEEDKSTIA